ncbi:hypothetical protein SAMN04488570_3285 [Nocardioides scoriae]|uniref:DUF3352 domain-containing protein n=1 Tax=Nocardioides scoriae TaxID=642780 RepID=A0A1H1WV58_9ACTN|nr:hypothetical protein [Nocardioides scoriae]SDT01037.1 hypothetical protein SAMN04488570_3285 [Nocardioides scoriae]
MPDAPRPGRRTLLVGVLVLALVAGAVVVGTLAWQRAHRTSLEQALAVVPASSVRVAFTDWSGVRRTLGADLGDTPSRDAVEAFAAKAYDADLSAASSVDEAAGALQQLYGFGPATARWEAYAQSRDGAVMVLAPPDGTDYDVLADNLRSAGYDAPAKRRTDGGVWVGGIDLVSRLDPTLTPELQYVALLPGQGLVVTSDTEEYLASSVAVASGDADGLTAKAGVDDLAGRLGTVDNALVWPGDFACEDLAMSQADDDDQAQADDLVRQAGGVTPLAGFAMGMTADRTLHVVSHFESSDQARANLRPRARLAVGEAVGRSGRFSDDFDLTRSTAVGSDVLLDLAPKRDDAFVLSALYDGPVLFATC